MNRPRCLRRHLAGAIASTVGLLPAAQAAVTYDTRALSSQPAPGTAAGVVFADVSNPVINAAGQVAFLGDLTGGGVNATNDSGIWSGGDGSLGLVARIGDAAPGAPAGITYGIVGVPLINSQGESAYLGLLSGSGLPANQNRGVWSESAGSPGSPGPVAVSGNAAAGTAPGEVYSVLGGPRLNNAGQTAFSSFLAGNGIPDGTESGIWSTPNGTPNAPRLIARTGEPAPGTGSGVVYRSLDLPSLNPNGQTTYFGELTGTGVNGTNDAAIWSESGNVPNLVVRTGDTAPGAGAGVVFFNLGTPALNAAGQIAFAADLAGSGVQPDNRESLWTDASANPGDLPSLVVRAGTAAPGAPGGAVFNSFADPVINQDGDLAFRGELLGGGVQVSFTSGVWTGSANDLDLVARASENAPGTPNGVIFRDFDLPALNGNDQVAFRAVLDGTGVNGSNDRGIWATDPNGQLTLIVRTGDLFDVNDDPALEDLRTVETLDVVRHTGNQDGRRSSLNDAGQLAFAASFTDGSSGIFVANLSVAGLIGDFNLNGSVEQGDLNLVLSNWGAARTFEDGVSAFTTANVDQEELNAVLNNWGSSTLPNLQGFDVPEPLLGIMMLGIAGTGCRRRGQR
ncbi:MAG: choice-of-anchor tandem repeat NxxGxxAF-containing protein [Planctomycetota bacterium]